MLHRNIDVENIPFVDLTSHHRLVDRYCNLFSGTGLSYIVPLILYPDDLSDPLSTTIDERILRLDDLIEHFDPDDGGIATSERESLQQHPFSKHRRRPRAELESSTPPMTSSVPLASLERPTSQRPR